MSAHPRMILTIYFHLLFARVLRIDKVTQVDSTPSSHIRAEKIIVNTSGS